MSVLHVRQIANHLRDLYQSTLWDPALSDDQNLSRLLARYALDLTLGEQRSDPGVVTEITDGAGDRGIDAVAVDGVANRVIVVQSKWRGDGRGGLKLAGVLRFADGVRGILDLSDEAFPDCAEETRRAIRRVMNRPGGKISIVSVTTASETNSDEVQAPIGRLLEVLNDVGADDPIATFQAIGQGDLFESLTQSPRLAVDLDIQLLEWGTVSDPIQAMYGRVSAHEVAEWFQEHGTGLFSENIRVVLPRSEINNSILRTVVEEPSHFLYYNNGITILAREIKMSPAGAATREARFVKAVDASVVNGAQTVSTLGRALREGYAHHLTQAQVLVRIIQVGEDSPGNLGRQITKYANTQNVVSAQDFVFLDPEQHRLAREVQIEGSEYILRAGEVAATESPKHVFEPREAAVALACASTSLGDSVQAKREVSRLFDREDEYYKRLFNASTNGLVLVRALEVVKIVDDALDKESKQSAGLRSGIAGHAGKLTAHVILGDMGQTNLADPDFDFDTAKASIRPRAIELLNRLEGAFPPNSYPGNVFKNQARCAELFQSVRES